MTTLAIVLFVTTVLGWIKAWGQESIIRELRNGNEQLAEALAEAQSRQIVTTLDLREARRERDAGRQAIRETEAALKLAKCVIRLHDPIPFVPTEPTPLFDATVQNEQEVMAQVFKFRSQIDALDEATETFGGES